MPQPQLQKTLRVREVQARQTKRGDIYEVHGDDNQSYATFDKGIALEAQSFAGPAGPIVVLTYTEKQKGQYTDRYVEKIEQQLPTGGIAYAPNYTPPPAQSTLPTFGNAPAVPIPTQPLPTAPDKELRIMRQTATKVAVHLLPYLPPHEQTPSGLLVMADFLVDYYTEGAPAAPYAPAQRDPGPDQRPAPSDSDIPF